MTVMTVQEAVEAGTKRCDETAAKFEVGDRIIENHPVSNTKVITEKRPEERAIICRTLKGGRYTKIHYFSLHKYRHAGSAVE